MSDLSREPDQGHGQVKSLLNRTLLTEGEYETSEPIDLTNCEKEPIHIPGRIQPHGALIAVEDDAECRIRQCSTNVRDYLGIAAEDLLGRRLDQLLGPAQLGAIRVLASHDPDPAKMLDLNLSIEVQGTLAPFQAIIHKSGSLLIIELEPSQEEGNAIEQDSQDFEWIQLFFTRIKQSASRAEAGRITAEQLQRILGYDRVMIYEFDAQWNGKVIAEAKTAGLESFLGHQYPASDIPKQARELYLRNWLRLIVDVHYEPVDIVPTLHPETAQPLNLSLSTLRSVSPIHIEYLKNMNVGATMTISLIQDNKLWGLIACHHQSTKYITYRKRNLCNFLGMFFSNELYQRQQLDDYQAEADLRTMANRLSRIFIGHAAAGDVMQQLEAEQATLLGMMSAAGAAICYRNHFLTLGSTPAENQVRGLAGWLAQQAQGHLYHTSQLSLDYPPAEAYRKEASGALYMALSARGDDFIIWFRPEVVQIVEWAGDPAKAAIRSEDGVRISPRKSFEKWRQTVAGTSLPWEPKEIRALPDFHAIILKQTENQLHQAEEKALLDQRIFRENEKRYMQLMELSTAIFFTVTEGKIVHCNIQAARLFRAEDPQQLIGTLFEQWVQPSSRPGMQTHIARLQSSAEQLLSVSEHFIGHDGSDLEIELTMVAIQYGGRSSILAVAKHADPGQLQEQAYSDITSILQKYIITDPLTEIPNRRHFEHAIVQEWLRCRQENVSLSLIMLDIDNFRHYNSMHGFQGGNLSLQWIADVLRAFGMQYGASIARYDGGLFAMYLSRIDEAIAASIAEGIRQGVVAEQNPAGQMEMGDMLTISLGVSTVVPREELSWTELLTASRQALYNAKREGKNRVAVQRVG